MKKIIVLLMVATVALGLTACGKKVCSECGTRVSKGYTIFGNFMCEDCFY